ncbi:MAG: prepilin-type N-terminal cleavage/methylation domain-containing protein [Rhodospirillaceae bacterium]|nr:prepilin-type N-terminal cleavage/methylation domain-containing protein [Rhodospirillaceae bacterium]
MTTTSSLQFPDSASARGFTLFEVLVVLVITGMISAVLMQGFSIVLRTRLSVADKIGDLQSVVVNQSIVTEPIRGIVPDESKDPTPFSGQARGLSGRTVRPLLSPPGVPTFFTLTLENAPGGTKLVYEEKGMPKADLAHWPGNGPTFKYRDFKGSWLSAWPPPGSVSQTPWLIWIDGGPTLAPLMISLQGSHRPATRFEDLPFVNRSPFAQ